MVQALDFFSLLDEEDAADAEDAVELIFVLDLRKPENFFFNFDLLPVDGVVVPTPCSCSDLTLLLVPCSNPDPDPDPSSSAPPSSSSVSTKSIINRLQIKQKRIS